MSLHRKKWSKKDKEEVPRKSEAVLRFPLI
jgi:hypothetical protein